LITVIQSQLHPQSPGFIWWKNPPPNIPTAVPIMNQVLNHYGLPSVKSAGDLFLGDLILVVGIPELDPLPDTADVTYIGPLLWQKQDAVVPKWFSELKSDKPVVWIYTGKLRYAGSSRTAMDSEIVLQACLEALEGEDIQVVLTTGHNDLPRSSLPLPANFRFEPFVPGLAMAQRSNLIIHHGGYGSCQTGAYVAIPAVIIPTMSERESNARRLQDQGAAEIVLPTSDSTGKRKRVDSGKLAATVKNVLFTPSYKENAERLRTKLLKYGGPGEAARRIEQALPNSRHQFLSGSLREFD
jgi:UDP:flavonoid glycosyltransferase YjiC (YdhE family)